MIKQHLNYFVTLAVLSSGTTLFADSNVAAEVANLKNDINEAHEKLVQTYVNDAEISGSKKEAGLRLINQAKMNDVAIDKLLNDSEISESKKSKIVKKLQKLANEAKALTSKQDKTEKAE